jgi:hypothetical protein
MFTSIEINFMCNFREAAAKKGLYTYFIRIYENNKIRLKIQQLNSL